jgi:hypothetical protein
MNINHKLLVVIAAMALPGYVRAFDISTHAAMTTEAIKQSQITGSPNTSSVLKKLGLYNKDDVFKERYIDIGTTLTSRNGTQYENNVMDSIRGRVAGTTIPNPYTIPGWIIRGAIREDDNTIETKQGTPEGDEPGGVFNRVYGHFYDPFNNRGLTVANITVGAHALDWATRSGAQANGRENRYNTLSAREAMWRALTLKKLSNGTLSDVPITGNGGNLAALQEGERKAYWATMFRALGDMVHLVQDMGQPQHTRNDAHSGLGCIPGTDTCAGGHASFVENYLKARTLQSGSFTLPEGLFSTSSGRLRSTTAPQLIYAGYTPPTFNSYQDYFSTGDGKGLANYSNRGFFSAGTNLNDANQSAFPQPSASGLSDTTVTLKDDAGNVTANIFFKAGTVDDRVTGTSDADVKLTTYGIFDQFLIESGKSPRYSLNSYNYDDQAKLLIPRAVGYSAGLIDYFFRGTLEIKRPSEGVFAAADHAKPENQCAYNAETTRGCGFKKIKMKLKNTTADIVAPAGGGIFKQDMAGGQLYAIAKFHNNACFDSTFQAPIYGTSFNTACRSADEAIALSDVQSPTPFTLAAGEEKELEFTFNTDAIPFSATDLYIQVVYRGKLGAEDDAVVVATYDVSEPTFMTIANYSDVEIDGDKKICAYPVPTNPKKPFYIDAKLYVLVGKLLDPGPPQYKELIVTHLEPAQYARFAFLGDALEANMYVRAYLPPDRGAPWVTMTNGVDTIVSQVVVPTLFQRNEEGVLYYPNEEYKVREGYGHLWGIYNSRFTDLLDRAPRNVPYGYEDAVKIVQTCPGTMALRTIDRLSF